MKRVTILFPQGGMASCAISPMDIFRSAGIIWNHLQGQPEEQAFGVTTASLDGQAAICYDGTGILPDQSIKQVRKPDLVIIPSIGIDLDAGLTQNADLIDWLRRRRKAGAELAAICSGASLLAEAGILDGLPATTHWGLVEQYRQRYPKVNWQPELFITDSDGVYCGAGVYAALDLSLYLVERFVGRRVAIECAKALLIDPPRTSQAGFAVNFRRRIHSDEKIQQVQTWLKHNFREKFRFEDVATQRGMSPRNFVRRFKHATGEAPLHYLHRLRIEAAKELLEAEYKTLQEVAGEVGYEDVIHFRNLFKRHTGISPNAYRRRFGGH